MAAAIKYKKSDSGFYAVKLLAVFPHKGFIYKPSADRITVDEELLAEMIAAGVVSNVNPAD